MDGWIDGWIHVGSEAQIIDHMYWPFVWTLCSNTRPVFALDDIGDVISLYFEFQPHDKCARNQCSDCSCLYIMKVPGQTRMLTYVPFTLPVDIRVMP
jgi:hypothetical protein